MKNLINTGLFLLICNACLAQQVGTRIVETTVSLFNNSNNKLAILLGEPSSNMDTFELKANEVWYSPTYTINPIIKIQTRNIIKTYQLRLGKNYMIYWNKRKNVWDISKTKKER